MDEASSQGLQTRDLCKSYGGLTVAKNINLSLVPGNRTALIGPNGAGKTTFADLVTGITRPSSGSVFLDGRDITNMPEPARVRAGIAKTFQITTLFKGLTVAEHVRIALLERERKAHMFWPRETAFADLEAEVTAVLRQLDLGDHRDEVVSELAYGQQRLVEMAIALALRPRILLLDEPTAGVPTAESGLIVDAIERLPSELAVLIIEHDMEVVFRFARNIIVLVGGTILTEGPPEAIANDTRVRELYLGTGHG